MGFAAGVGDGRGMLIPGMLVGVCGDAVGCAVGIGMPGMSVFGGVADALGVGDGIAIG